MYLQSLSGVYVSEKNDIVSEKNDILSEENGIVSEETNGINKAIEFLKENYTGDYSLDDVARVASFSPFHFIRVFKAYTGKTPYRYLLDFKIEKAREMLESECRSVTDICFSCGFNSLSHFTSVFKKKVGAAPSEYRRKINDSGVRKGVQH